MACLVRKREIFSPFFAKMRFSTERIVDNAIDMLAKDLDSIDTEYAIVGGNALKVHGFFRFTNDVDVLVAKGGKNMIRTRLVGRGYAPRFREAKSKFLNTLYNVHINVLEEGECPGGDNNPSQLPFHNPSNRSFKCVNSRGTVVKYIDLKTIIDMKLASYQCCPNSRERDKLDVIDLLKVTNVGTELSVKLDPSVVDLFMQCLQRAERELQEDKKE